MSNFASLNLPAITWPLLVSIAFLCVIGLLILIALWVWHHDKTSDFDLRQALTDSVTGKLSIEKIAFMGAFLTMSWALVAMTLNEKLTEWYVLAYTGPFALARTASQGLAVWRDVTKKDAPAPGT